MGMRWLVALVLVALALAVAGCNPYGKPKPYHTVEIEVDESGHPRIKG